MIRLEQVSKIHDPQGPAPFQSLFAVDLHVAEGEFVVLSGDSGSGKTTLLSIIGALARPTSGQVLVAGQPVAKLPDRHASAFRARTLGFVFQHYNLLDDLSVRDNVLVPLLPRRLKRKRLSAMVDRALEVANIGHKAGQAVRDLSGGEKQRCAIARAVAGDPQIILCDEPTAHLDRDNARAFVTLLQELNAAGKTVLVATHDPLLADLAPGARRVRIRDGRIDPS
jgi:putative ABC transport system ATP-binding protein